MFLLLLAARPAAGQKVDTLWLKNNDRIVGEVKKLDRALLSFSTDNIQTISVEWDAVLMLVSRDPFEVEVQSGHKYYGRLARGPAGMLVVAGPFASDTLPLVVIAHIVPMNNKFWSRLDGYVDLGFSYQLANHTVQLTSGAEVKYRGPKAAATINTTLLVQDQDSLDQTSRASVSLSEQLFLGKRYNAGLFQAWEMNEELDLISRTKLGAGVGRMMAQTNSIAFALGAGVGILRERYSGQDEAEVTAEGQFIADFDAFRYNQPKLDLTTSLSIYPGLTEWGRVRIDFDGRVSYEIIKDFYIAFSVFERFDSRPPTETAAKSDFGTTLSISWSF